MKMTIEEREIAFKKRGRKISQTIRTKQANGTYRAPRSKEVICVETGEHFDSCTAASKKFDTSINIISLSCRYGQPVNGYHFKFVKGESVDNSAPRQTISLNIHADDK